MSGRHRTILGAAAVGAGMVVAVFAGHAQALQVRGTGIVSAQFYELRPLVQDTVALSQVVTDSLGRRTFDGFPVTCPLVDRCTYYRSTDVEGALAATQDLRVTAWGLPVRGLSAVGMLRFRQDVGGAAAWPRSDDAFDLLLGYLELDRTRYRVRLGRLRTLSGLGFSGYDGAEVRLALPWQSRLELYGGRSLARGLEEPRDDAYDPAEPFAPDRQSWLLGVAAGWEPVPGSDLELRYQRDLLSDRSVLLSERASLDASSRVGPLAIDVGVDYDVARTRFGKSRLAVAAPVARDVVVEGTLRRYRPYFELWTIWGWFDPVPYNEAELAAAAGRGEWHARASLAWRAYEDSHAPIIRRPLEEDALRAALTGSWSREPWRVSAGYRLERGFGAWSSSGDAAVLWQPVRSLELGVHGSAQQQILEFRLGEAYLLGGGGSARWRVSDRIAVWAGGAVYRQTYDGRPTAVDWSQRRAWAGLEYGFGAEPGGRAAPLPPGLWPEQPRPSGSDGPARTEAATEPGR